jgi:hypothetical protein
MHNKVAEWYNYYHSINTFVPLPFILQSSEFINHGFFSLTDTESNTDITYQNYTLYLYDVEINPKNIVCYFFHLIDIENKQWMILLV